MVTDVGSLSSRHLYRPGLKYFSDTEKMIEDHYPELLYKVLIIRPPRIFNLLYGMVKHTFDPVTRAKFELVSGDPLARMAEVIDKVSTSRERATLRREQGVAGSTLTGASAAGLRHAVSAPPRG